MSTEKKNSDDLTNNRTRDLVAFNTVPQPTTLPRFYFEIHIKVLFHVLHDIICLTETWLKGWRCDHNLFPGNYTVFRVESVYKQNTWR
jgi:hypothetical protein